MNQPDELQIIQEIVTIAVSATEPGWTELMVTYHVDELQSDFGNSYLIGDGDAIKEKALPFVPALENSLRKLRAFLTKGDKQPFSSCKLHVLENGKFNVTYGYEEVNWDSLVSAGWNFS